MRPPRRRPLSAADDRPPPLDVHRGGDAAPNRLGRLPGRKQAVKSSFAERERERLIAAILPDVPFDGWTTRALRHAARRLDVPIGEAEALFPRGAPDMIAEFSHWADRQMLERLAAEPAEPVSLSDCVALAIRLRFEAMLPWR